MKKFLLLVCISVCATRVYCAPTDDKYSWVTRLGMYLRKSRRRIAKELEEKDLYAHLLVRKESCKDPSQCTKQCDGYCLYHFFKDSNVGISERMIVVKGPNVNIEESCLYYIVDTEGLRKKSNEIISTIALHYPQKFISFLREIFSEEVDSDFEIKALCKDRDWIKECESRNMTGEFDYDKWKKIIDDNNKKCNSIIDKELSRATQCGVAATVGVAAAGAGLYFLRNEIATGVKNGTQSLVAAVASGLGK